VTTPAHPATSAKPRTLRTDPAPAVAGDRMLLFRDPLHAHEPLAPFAAYETQLQLRPATPDEARATDIKPRFQDRGKLRIITIPLDPGTDLYGTGEVSGPLRRNGQRANLWNSDSFGYSARTHSIYQAQPFVMGLRSDGSAFGIICQSTWRCVVEASNSGDTLRFTVGGTYSGDTAEGIHHHTNGLRAPSPAIMVIERDSPHEVVEALAELTGTMPLPPRWALGYHQCRWSYNPESRIRQLADDFRKHKVPCDVIWFDIDYMDSFRCFTFDKEQFPDTTKLNADLRAQGFRTVYMIDPGLKVDPEYKVFAAGLAGDHFVKNPDGTNYDGKVWPGSCHFPDFTRARTRAWWSTLYKDFMATGIDGVWNDMNEPAVFDVPGKTMPDNTPHQADAELGGPGPHAAFHNIYGMQMVRASREGIQAANPQKRPFILTRANFLGGHRYAATWTGDNVSDWTHLRWSISMILNLGLSGQPLAGPDIGGFAENATPELFARWMGIGSLLPFSRAHSMKSSVDHEPWSFGEECLNTCRLALERRYRLLPYLYTLAFEASTTGLPMARPLFFADPADPTLRGVDDQFLLGDDLLVRCNVQPGTPVADHRPLPPGTWLPFEPATSAHGKVDLNLPMLYVRAGAIIPLGPSVQFSDEKPLDPLTLVFALDEEHQAVGALYEDAGDGHGYAKGDFLLSHYRAYGQNGHATISLIGDEGNRDRPTRGLHVEMLQPGQKPAHAQGKDGDVIRVG
jgi:alpha-glucosidase